jgi:NTE family protein
MPRGRYTSSALILTGGGARAAYQVGVLRAIAELLPAAAPTPFRIVCGTSAGAINAASLAAASNDFGRAVATLESLWSRLCVSDIYGADFLHFIQRFGRWLLSRVSTSTRHSPGALLDNAPLARLLSREIDFAAIRKGIDEHFLDALTITASSYRTGMSVSFCAVSDEFPLWQRSQRIGVGAEIGTAHLLASSAIPFIFSPVLIGDEYFGDGAMGQLAPTAPALHLGAERILVIGAARTGNKTNDGEGAGFDSGGAPPSPAQIGGHVLASIFTDALGTDLEKVRLVNIAARQIPPERLAASPMPLREIALLVITPSIPLETLALAHLDALPLLLRLMLGGVRGIRTGGAGLLSYLLFESAYCKALIALGYQDAQERREELIRHLSVAASTHPVP